MSKRKVPLTKAGKPDKRYVKSTRSKSKVTKKYPTKRTQKRRTKKQIKGYTANPTGYLMAVTNKNGKILAYWTGKTFDTVKSYGKIYANLTALKRSVNSAKKKIGAENGLMAVPVHRGKNPVPRSKASKIEEAMRRYKSFCGHDPKFIDEHDLPKFDVAFKVGVCDGILYTTVRDGKREKYIHKFKAKAKPVLASKYDGSQIGLVNGNYEFTDRGIIDK